MSFYFAHLLYLGGYRAHVGPAGTLVWTHVSAVSQATLNRIALLRFHNPGLPFWTHP
jgi:hypothetical protein